MSKVISQSSIRLLYPTSIFLAVKDLLRLKNNIKSNNIHIKAALNWLKIAQDKSGEGGVCAWYSLSSGWAASYIETTGYILSTFLECAKYFNDSDLERRAERMATFLLEMQLINGGFRSEPLVKNIHSQPVVFDTGQDIIGLVDIYKFNKQKKYIEAAQRAATFLCSIQEKSGSWIKFEYGISPHTYETRTAWALLKLYEITKEKKYRTHAIQNLDWAAKNQLENGWFKSNFFPPPNISLPYTHNISYAIEGFLWSGLILNSNKYISIAKKAADALLDNYQKNNFLFGAFNQRWEYDGNYSCLTGDAQISLVWLNLYKITHDEAYLIAAQQMNKYLKSKQDIKIKNKNIVGGIAGSDPIYGDISELKGYCRMAYINWAAKFFIDALLEEEKILSERKT